MFKNIFRVLVAPHMRTKTRRASADSDRYALIRSNNIIYSSAGAREGEIGPATFFAAVRHDRR
jgi:hypothetical protein